MSEAPDPQLAVTVESAEQALRRGLIDTFGEGGAPLEWLADRFAGHSLTEVFLDPRAYPVVSLPWWATAGQPDAEMHRALAASSMAGYLFIRMVDDVSDGDHRVKGSVLPTLGFLHSEFERPYHSWFPVDHEFWQVFRQRWYGAASTTATDLGYASVSRLQFEEVAARKTQAAVVPVAAALWGSGRPELVAPWERFIDMFGRWHQFQNDLKGIERDEASGNATYVLTTALAAAEKLSPRAWLWTAGSGWAKRELGAFEEQARSAAQMLDCAALTTYLESRFSAWRHTFERVQSSLDKVASIQVRPTEQAT
jgi:hypothetical protein